MYVQYFLKKIFIIHNKPNGKFRWKNSAFVIISHGKVREKSRNFRLGSMCEACLCV